MSLALHDAEEAIRGHGFLLLASLHFSFILSPSPLNKRTRLKELAFPIITACYQGKKCNLHKAYSKSSRFQDQHYD